jgi:hypothetical protein
MIYLHCGWPKTGTTSLQAALVGNQERLASAGLLYPEEWRRDLDGSHNDLSDLLHAHQERDCGFDELRSFLLANTDRDILFCSESLTLWLLLGEPKYEVILDFLVAMQDVAPVRCIWTLRRFDEVLHSMFRQMALRRGLKESQMTELLATLRTGELFMRMRRLEDAVGGDAVYVRYDHSGLHNAELLRAFGMSDDAVGTICRELAIAPRLNITPSHKQVAAAENIAAIKAGWGLELDRTAMCRAFEHQGFQFHHDGPCVLFEQATRLNLHESMLEAAHYSSFVPYGRFFGEEKLDNFPPVSRLEPDVLTAEDLTRLSMHLRFSTCAGDAA